MAAPYSAAGGNARPGTQWHVESGYDSAFVAPSSYLLKREIRNKIFQAYDERALYDFLIHSNKTLKSANTTFRWFEWDSYNHTHTVESVTGTSGAGNPAVYKLDNADHLDSGALVGNLSQIKVKDLVIVYTATSAVKGYVIATNKAVLTDHTVTVDPLDDAVNLVALSAATNQIVVYSSAASDGAVMTASTARLPVPYYGYVQIIDTQKTTDGGEAANEAEVMVDGKPYFYNQLISDGDLEQRMKIENAFLFGVRNTKADPVETPKLSYMTAGLEWYADNQGYAEPYSGTFSLTDLQNVQRNLDLEKAPAKQLLLVGNELDLAIDDFMKGRLDNTAINWAEMGIGSVAGSTLDFGVDGFKYGNFTWIKKKFGALNALGLTGGITNSNYPYMGFSVSWDRVRTADGQDADTIALRYKASDRENRFMQFWDRDKKQTNRDQFEFNHKSEVGLMCALSRHINKIYKA